MKKILPLIMLLCMIALLIPSVKRFPIWDSDTYARCFIATSQSFQLKDALCGNHPMFPTSFFFAGLLTLFPYNVGFIHISLLVLFAGMAMSYWYITSFYFGRRGMYAERFFCFALFLTSPVLLSSVTTINVDIFFTAYLLFLAALLFAQKPIVVFLSAVLFLFTKESSIPVVVLFMLFLFLPRFQLKRNALFVSLGLALFLNCLFVLGKHVIAPGDGFWIHFTFRSIVKGYLTLPFGDTMFVPYLFQLILFHFQWVYSVICLLGVLVWVVRIRKIRWEWLFAGSVFVLLSYIVLGFRPYATNPRYVLAAMVWLPILGTGAITMIIQQKLLRRIVLLSLICLFLSAQWVSFDPLTKRIYSTFSVGKREMYITTISGECCGYGRDQIVYNLQFTAIRLLKEKAVYFIQPSWDTTIVMHSHAMMNDLIQEKTFTLTYDPRQSFRPLYTHPQRIASFIQKPEKLYYLAFPFVPNDAELPILLSYYDISNTQTIQSGDYAMDVYTLVRKPDLVNVHLPDIPGIEL